MIIGAVALGLACVTLKLPSGMQGCPKNESLVTKFIVFVPTICTKLSLYQLLDDFRTIINNQYTACTAFTHNVY